MIINPLVRRPCPKCGSPVALYRHVLVERVNAWYRLHWVPCVECQDFRSYEVRREDVTDRR